MLELSSLALSAIELHASPAACDRVVETAVSAGALQAARVGRVAPDEVLVVAAAGKGAATRHAVQEMARTFDPGAFALETTDGWTGWRLDGPAARDAFAYLSELELPELDGFAQGDAVHVSVKVFTTADDQIDVLVPAFWGPYLRERILAACAAFDLQEVGAS